MNDMDCLLTSGKSMRLFLIFLFFSSLLTSCIPVDNIVQPRLTLAGWGRTITHPEVLYFGDSLCTYIYDTHGTHFVDIAGIEADCAGGRRASNYTKLPSGYKTIFFALGTNDVGYVSIVTFTNNYQRLLDSAPAGTTVYCVLPQEGKILGLSSTAYIDAIKSICANPIQPSAFGVTYGSADGLHWNAADHAAFGNFLKQLVE
jgi:lysophospholipase L1-like esterase